MSNFPSTFAAYEALMSLFEGVHAMSASARPEEIQAIIAAMHSLLQHDSAFRVIAEDFRSQAPRWKALPDDEFVSTLFRHLQGIEQQQEISLQPVFAILVACVVMLRPTPTTMQNNSRQTIDENVIVLVRPETNRIEDGE